MVQAEFLQVTSSDLYERDLAVLQQLTYIVHAPVNIVPASDFSSYMDALGPMPASCPPLGVRGDPRLFAASVVCGYVVFLSLAGLGLGSLPSEIGYLKGLEALRIDGNRLQSLPSAFKYMRNLRRLFAGNNQFSIFPRVLCSLYRLEHLDLANNQITAIPHAIGECLALETLNIENNYLKTLPFAADIAPRLRRLKIGGNPCMNIKGSRV